MFPSVRLECFTVDLLILFLIFCIITLSSSYHDIWDEVKCYQDDMPDECNRTHLSLASGDDYDLCGPAYLTRSSRNYFLAASGRRLTYKENKVAFRRIKIVPKMLRGVVPNSLQTTVMGRIVNFPIGFSPTALQKLAHPDGELGSLKAILHQKTIMILSAYASTSIEDMATMALNGNSHLWMQTYFFQDRKITSDIVKRAEKNGFKAIVVTVDSPVDAYVTCNARNQVQLPPNVGFENVNFTIGGTDQKQDASATFEDITWLKSITTLPIVAKGILSDEDARRAVLAGASAILVSNHGGRQVDGAPATIDALPAVVDALKGFRPRREVYMDGGVRTGQDVYKAIARGARMVFLGRLVPFSLALGGAAGVADMLNLLVAEFNQTMLLSGASKISDIKIDTLIPRKPRRE